MALIGFWRDGGPEPMAKKEFLKMSSVQNGDFIFIYLFNVFIYLRQRDRVQAEGGAEREGDTESEAGCRL